MKQIRIFYLIILLMIPVAASAQISELSLKESIRIALDQNLQYRGAEESLEIARAKMKESYGNFLPNINVSLIHTLDEKLMEFEMPPLAPGMDPTPVTIDFTKDFMASLQIRQPIFAGGAIWFNYRQNFYNYRAEEQNYIKQRLSTIFQTREAYYNVLLTEELITVSEEALKLNEGLLKNTELLYEQGMANKFEVLNAEVQYENIKPRVIEAKNSRNLAMLGFKNLLQLETRNDLILTRGLEFIERDFNLDSLLILSNQIRPDILQMEYQQNRMDQFVNLSYSTFSPTLALAADYNYRKDDFSWDMNKWEDNYSVNLVLSIPLFRGTSRIFKVQQANAAKRRVDIAQQAVITGVALEIEANYLKFYVAIEKLKLQSKNVERAEENVRIADLNYTEGLITPLEMSVAQMNLIETRIIHLKALYEYLISLAALEESVGIENLN